MTGQANNFLSQQDAEVTAPPNDDKTNGKGEDGGDGNGHDSDTSWVTAPPEHPWPMPLGNDAYHGLAGEFVRLIEPQTEADAVALLVQFLCMIWKLHW